MVETINKKHFCWEKPPMATLSQHGPPSDGPSVHHLPPGEVPT